MCVYIYMLWIITSTVNFVALVEINRYEQDTESLRTIADAYFNVELHNRRACKTLDYYLNVEVQRKTERNANTCFKIKTTNT